MLASAKAHEERLPAEGEQFAMAQNQGTHNQPSHEAQVKGGQHSHQGQGEHPGGNRTPPSREEAAKGGQHSHSGGNR
jgi:hypothetical protein